MLINYFFKATINSLIAYTEYFVNIKACNRDLFDSIKFYCLEGIPQPQGVRINGDNYLEFITSQDRPEFQPPPSLITTGSNSILLRVDIPTRPNGIILIFELWIISNNTQTYNLACLIEDLYDPNDFELDIYYYYIRSDIPLSFTY